ncbi:MAG: DUF4142 domain-containing protein [Chthoniobacterales bacterium]
MKRHFNSISRFALAAFATGGLCCGSVALAEETPASTMPPAKSEMKKPMAKTDKTAQSSSSMSKLSADDRTFIMDAAKGGMDEVQMGKMAEQKGKSADVKNIGKTMVTDHSKANNELMTLAKTKGVKVDSHAKMEKMSDANFDSAYLNEMVKDHEKDIADFEKEAKNGSDPEVKAWAKKTLPTLKKHLQMVQSAMKKMPKAG